MVTQGDWHIKRSKDGYGFETKDGSLACHFEHDSITKIGGFNRGIGTKYKFVYYFKFVYCDYSVLFKFVYS